MGIRIIASSGSKPAGPEKTTVPAPRRVLDVEEGEEDAGDGDAAERAHRDRPPAEYAVARADADGDEDQAAADRVGGDVEEAPEPAGAPGEAGELAVGAVEQHRDQEHRAAGEHRAPLSARERRRGGEAEHEP